MILLNIDEIARLALEAGYSGSRFISNETGAIAVSIAALLDNPKFWTNDEGELTEADIDEIQRITSQLEFELSNPHFIGQVSAAVMPMPPEGHLYCDGTVYEADDYPLLADYLEGSLYKFSATQFRVPDYRNRGLRDFGVNTPGATGGDDRIFISANNMPAHDHSYAKPAGYIAGFGVQVGSTPVNIVTDIQADVTGEDGGGQHINHVPLSTQVYWMIRAK